MTAKTSSNNEHANDVPLKTNVKHKYVAKSSDSVSVSKSVHEKKDLKKGELKRSSSGKLTVHSHKDSVRKVGSGEKASSTVSKVATKEHRKSPYRVVNIKVEKSPEIEIIEEIHRKISARSDSPTGKHSESPYKRIVRRLSKSPVRHVIKSPIRVSPFRRRSRTPIRRHPRTPLRKLSKSPIRRRSRSFDKHLRSPNRRITSPIRRPIRSPLRKYSRSPIRRHSRSPIRKRSRSPIRRHSRSPIRRHSRSPIRRHSRSPIRRHSRSPLRTRSRSPHRRRSRTPIRRSRSPQRHRSRSPIKRRSRSPTRRKSRSPYRRHSRSPLRLRSPLRRHSKSPMKRLSRSPHSSPLPRYKNTFRAVSPFDRPRNIQDHREMLRQFSRSKSPQIPFEKHLDRYDLSDYKVGRRSRSPSRSSISDKFLPFLNSLSGQDIDLDPVSDEDESNYFNTLDVHQNSDKMSTSKMVLAEFLKKFSMRDINPNDITVNKFMQFMQVHSSEIFEMMGSQSNAKSSKMTSPNVASSMQEQNAMLQQYLLHSLAGKLQGPAASNVPFSSPVSNVPPTFMQPPFIPNHPSSGFGHAPMVPGPDPSQSLNQPKIFPPNLSMPPPGQFPPMNQPSQNQSHPPPLPPKPRVPPEIMFKDLKATVNKLFGASISGGMQGQSKSNLPGFVNEPGPDKWDRGHPDAPKFNVSSDPKTIFNSPGKNLSFRSPSGAPVREEMPMSYNRVSEQFFNSRAEVEQARAPNLPIPPPNAKVSFCDAPSGSSKGNLFPVVNRAQGTSGMNSQSARGSVSDVKVSLAQRLASVLVKVGMIDVPAPLLQEMLMKIGAFSSSPPQDITEAEIVSILKRLGYL